MSRRNPVIARGASKLEMDKIAGWMAREGVQADVEPVNGHWGITVPSRGAARARAAFQRVLRNPKRRARRNQDPTPEEERDYQRGWKEGYRLFMADPEKASEWELGAYRRMKDPSWYQMGKADVIAEGRAARMQNPRGRRAKKNAGRKKSLPIPKAPIEFLVDTFHVGTPVADVQAEVRKRIEQSIQKGATGWTRAKIRQALDYAVKVHEKNQRQYREVMSGRLGRRKKTKNNPSIRKRGRSVPTNPKVPVRTEDIEKLVKQIQTDAINKARRGHVELLGTAFQELLNLELSVLPLLPTPYRGRLRHRIKEGIRKIREAAGMPKRGAPPEKWRPNRRRGQSYVGKTGKERKSPGRWYYAVVSRRGLWGPFTTRQRAGSAYARMRRRGEKGLSVEQVRREGRDFIFKSGGRFRTARAGERIP